MKKIFTLLIGIVFSIAVLNAQEAPPQAFSYKATFMKANGNAPLAKKTISLRINILNSGGASVYEEILNPTTNKDGQIDIVIGRGGIGFSSIEWSTGEFFLKIEVDVNGGTNYQPLSETQLLSVPYALYAQKAGSAINESDPIFKTYPAYGIKNGDISNWDAAYSWGNHAGLYKPLNYLPAWSEIANKPTSIVGFGITDAVTTMGDQTIAGNKTFTGTTTVSNALSAGNGFGSIYSETEKRPILGQRGNVSIGTASNWDWSELDVNGGVNILPGQWEWGSGLALSAWDAQDGGGEQYLIGSTGALAHEGAGKFFIRNTDHYWDAIFIMDNQGRVGIDMGFDGLPQYTLDVSGDINFTGELLKDGSSYSTGFLTNETDPIFISHAANGITSTNITNWNNAYSWGNHVGLYRPIGYVPTWSEIIDKPTFATVATSASYNDLNNKPTIDGSETKVTAGTNVTVTGEGTTTNPYSINSSGVGTTIPGNNPGDMQYWNGTSWVIVPVGSNGQVLTLVNGIPTWWQGSSVSGLQIGDSYQGGIVAYILQPDDPGYDANVQHGLIATPFHQGTAQWGCYGTTISGADGTAIGTGAQNTIDIVAGCTTAGIAAEMCSALVLDGYSDWYLPSKDELNKLYINRTAIGGFATVSYWSSTELSNSHAWGQYFYTGLQYGYNKTNTYSVRAVRAF